MITDSVIDTLEFETTNGELPHIIPVSGDIYAIAYQGPGYDGFIKTVEIATNGMITDSVIDTLEFDTSAGVAPNIMAISGNIYAVAYEGPSDDGFIKTVEISTNGQITDTIIDTLEFDTTEGRFPDLISISGDIYAIAYDGNLGNGFLKTIEIATNGQITDTVIDTFEFDVDKGGYPEIISISGDIYAIAYEGLGVDGFVRTLEISTNGTINNTPIDTIEFDASNGETPQIVQTSGNTYAIIYQGVGADGFLATISIESDGTIGAPVIDSLEYEPDSGQEPKIIPISGDVYALVYRGTLSDGFVTTITISGSATPFSNESDYNMGIFDKGAYKLYFDKSDGKLKFELEDNTANSWTISMDGAKSRISTLAVYNGKLYAGQGGTDGDGDIFVYDGSSWTTSYDGSEKSIISLAVYNGKLYAGQGINTGDGDILVYDGSSWTTSYDGTKEKIFALTVYDGKLYAGQGGLAGDGDVLAFEGSSWTTSYDGNQEAINALGVYDGKLYAGQGEGAGDGDIFVYDGSTWTMSRDGTEDAIFALGVYDGKLYAGQGKSTGDGDIFVYDGSNWTTSYDGSGTRITSLTAYNGKLYAGQGLLAGNGDIFVYDGSSWTTSYDGSTKSFMAIASYNGKLYAGQGDGIGNGDVYVMGDNEILSGTTSSWDSNWHHLAVNYDGSTIKTFLDGSLENSKAASITIDTNSIGLLLGKTYGSQVTGGSAEAFEGSMDEVAFWNRTLSDAEILSIYNNANGVLGTSDGGGIFNNGTLNLNRVTVSGNTTTGTGGGIYNGSIFNATNSTVSGNTAASHGGGIYAGLSSTSTTIDNSTIVFNISDNDNNSTGAGGGIYRDNSGGAVTISHTIVSDNTNRTDGSAAADDLFGTITSALYNLISDAATSGGLTNGVNNDMVGSSANLVALADNGGSTFTHELGSGSPAVDAGDPSYSGSLTIDQRGEARETVTIDIGSYETPLAFTATIDNTERLYENKKNKIRINYTLAEGNSANASFVNNPHKCSTPQT